MLRALISSGSRPPPPPQPAPRAEEEEALLFQRGPVLAQQWEQGVALFAVP